MQEFLIMGWGRSGTTVFTDLMNQHPDVIACQEIFHENIRICANSYKEIHPGLNLDNEIALVNRYLHRMNSGFVEDNLYKHVQETMPDIKACGFKTTYKICNYPEFVEYLGNKPNFKRIQITRKNVLAIYTSIKMMHKTEVGHLWHEQNKKYDHKVKVHMPVLETLKYIQEFYDIKKKVDVHLDKIETYPISYENVCKYPIECVRNSCEFLGIPRDKYGFKVRLTKTGKGKLADRISNFDEIVEALTGTEYEFMLTEEY